MKINVVCVGKLKEKYLVMALAEYVKRIRGFCEINVIEVPDISDDRADAMEKEAKSILSRLGSRDFVISLCIEGRKMDSIEFSKELQDIFSKKSSTISFVIGGSQGLHDLVKKRSDLLLSFSNMTFPHQLMRIILLEQIFRAFKIANNQSYHK